MRQHWFTIFSFCCVKYMIEMDDGSFKYKIKKKNEFVEF